MNRPGDISTVVLSLLTVSCAQVAPKPSPSAMTRASGTASRSAAPSTWVRASLAADGVSATFPSAPWESSSDLADRQCRYLSVETSEKATRLDLVVCRLREPESGFEMDVPEDALVSDFARIVSSTPVTRSGLVGRLVEGTGKDGGLRIKEMLVLGREVVLLLASTPRADLDRDVQQRFFDSLLVVPPLKTYSSVAGGFSLLVPSSAVEHALDNDDASLTEFFPRVVERFPLIVAGASRIPPPLRNAPRDVVIRMLSCAVTLVSGLTPGFAPVQSHGFAGFEVTFVSASAPLKGPGQEHGRARAFVVGDRLVVVAYLADTPEELDEPPVDEILGSLSWSAPH